MKCLIWGTGKNFKLLMLLAKWNKSTEIVGLVETEKQKEKVIWEDVEYKVYSANEIKEIEFDKIIISTIYVDEILSTMKTNEIPIEKAITPCILNANETKFDIVVKLLDFIDNAETIVSTLLTLRPMYGEFIQPMGYDMTEYTLFNDIEEVKKKRLTISHSNVGDYARVRTLELLIKEIKDRNIEGSLAEVGVFQGCFSKIIKHYFPDRKMYLYDTFQGFDERDAVEEINKNNIIAEWSEVFKTASLDKIKESLGQQDTWNYRVGYFPETIEDEKDEQFCLVSLDADLYNPTLAGLEFFYPRLAKGGYILIHDYNHRGLDGYAISHGVRELVNFAGIRDAVNEFEKRHGAVCKVPISDRNGTLIITK